MTKTCPECGKVNPNNSDFCKNCGTDIKSITPAESSKGGVGAWWGKQSNLVKGLTVVGICCIGLILIIGIGGILSPDTTTTTNTSTTPTTTTTTPTTTTTTDKTPKTVTIAQLYGKSIPEGTYVKVTGTALESDGYRLRIRNSDYQDVLATGFGLSAYEDQSVTIVGTFVGPTSYDTAMGSTRTVPTIENAEIV